jgi:hypothetical protein
MLYTFVATSTNLLTMLAQAGVLAWFFGTESAKMHA